MPWKPQHEDDFPTLGWYAIDWITENLKKPDVMDYEPFVMYPEQEEFILEFYRLDPKTCRRVIRRGVLSRPRGWGKSPFAGALMYLEGLGDIVPDGWDADGQPVGRPWSTIRQPLVQIAAVSEDQTQNTWSAVLDMADGPVYDNYPGLEPLGGRVNLPYGRMEPITSSGRSAKGARAVFAVLDQTEAWVSSNGGELLHTTMDSNAAKTGGSYVETPNAFIPGEGSVAEKSASDWELIKAGKSRGDGLYYDHREAPASIDMSERESLTLGLRYAYGDSSGHPGGCLIHEPACPPGHVDIDSLIQTIWAPSKDVQVSRADFLNQITHASDSWLSRPEVNAVVKPDIEVAAGEMITVGFDGSRGRSRGVADATALVGCRVSDGHIFEIDVWEQPKNVKEWTVPVEEVNRRVAHTFDTYEVAAFYADPSGWTTQLSQWEAKFGSKLKVKAKHDAPMSYWPRGKGSDVPARLEELHDAVVNRECSLSESPTLISHFLNARRRRSRGGYLLYKAYPDSPDKIDAAYAAVMAWKARTDAVSRGATLQKKQIPVRRRVKAVSWT